MKQHNNMSEVHGQSEAKAAMERCAVAGGHLLMIGPPGAGMTMLARRMTGILPVMTESERDEITATFAIAGCLYNPLEYGTAGADNYQVVTERPFLAPHFTVSMTNMEGAITKNTTMVGARPGQLALANHGVLLLDELPEFPRVILKLVAFTMKYGEVASIHKYGHWARFPAKFTLIGAMGPCPCGYHGYEHINSCQCTKQQIGRYQSRIDVLRPFFSETVYVNGNDYADYYRRVGYKDGDTSAVIRARVEAARAAL